MPVTITFNKLSEKKPAPNENVIWLRKTGAFGYQGFEPSEVKAEYMWEEHDSVDEYSPTGNSAVFDEKTDSLDLPVQVVDGAVWKLILQFDGLKTCDDDLWISGDDYLKCFEDAR